GRSADGDRQVEHAWPATKWNPLNSPVSLQSLTVDCATLLERAVRSAQGLSSPAGSTTTRQSRVDPVVLHASGANPSIVRSSAIARSAASGLELLVHEPGTVRPLDRGRVPATLGRPVRAHSAYG